MNVNNSAVVLVGSLLVALGGWGVAFQEWSDMCRLSSVFSLAGVVGGVLLAWIGKSPLRPKE